MLLPVKDRTVWVCRLPFSLCRIFFKAEFFLLFSKRRFSLFYFFFLLAFNAENILIMEAIYFNILYFKKDSLALKVSFSCCVLRIYRWSEEKGTEKELQIANLSTTRIISDNPGLTMGYSASSVWQGVTVLWPYGLHSCHLSRSRRPHRCCGYKWRQIVCETLQQHTTLYC